MGSGYLPDQVTRHNIPPDNITIEIVESKTVDTGVLVRFVNNYHDGGLDIAFDDVGTEEEVIHCIEYGADLLQRKNKSLKLFF